jgi:ribonucleoside-diphosphate reductase subunit M2
MSRVEIVSRLFQNRAIEQLIDDYLLDPILIESDKRYCLFPLQYPTMHELWQNAVNTFWNPQEIHLKKDLHDWMKLTADEQFYIKYTLAFFASSDNIVAENIFSRFSTEIQVPEIRTFYAMQLAQESIHTVTYNMLIEGFVTNLEERRRLFLAIRTHDMIKQKAAWAIKWITNDAPFAKRLVAFAIVEMIFFSAAFCSIFWLKKRGLMPGLTLSNEWISRDEASHCKAAWMIYDLLQPENRLTNQDIHALIDEAVTVESRSVKESLPVALIGMNADHMIQYVKYVADQLLVELKAPKLYHTSNPFNWMELISMPGKTNFFERTNADYMKISSAKTNLPAHNKSLPEMKTFHNLSESQESYKDNDDKPYVAEDIDF